MEGIGVAGRVGETERRVGTYSILLRNGTLLALGGVDFLGNIDWRSADVNGQVPLQSELRNP